MATARPSHPAFRVYGSWDYKHQPPGAAKPLIMLPNVLPDLAAAMKHNPDLKVMVNGGYFDVSTPYYEGWFETHHMAIPPSAAEEHRVSLLQVRPHGLCAPADAEAAARQCRRLHRDRSDKSAVKCRRWANSRRADAAHSGSVRTMPS